MSNDPAPKSVSRRAFGSLSFAGATIAGAAGQAFGQNHNLGALKGEVELVRALRKMRSNTDGSLRCGWLEAKRLAYIDGEITPLLILLAGTISTSRDNGDGTFDINTIETTYYIDLETRELLDHLKMPGTGKTVKVPLYRSGPGVVTIGTKTKQTEVSSGDAGVVSKDGKKSCGSFRAQR